MHTLIRSALRPLLFAALLCSSALARAQEAPLDALPYSPVFDLTNMDRKADPCEDFYRYACGGWQDRNPIPPDQASWDVSSRMAEDNLRLLWGILQRLADRTRERTVQQRQIGDAFAACMDEDVADALGPRALAPMLGDIDAASTRRDLPALLARLQLHAGSGGPFFTFTAAPDYEDAGHVIAFANSGGLGLPDRDYYLRTDAASRRLLAAYATHVERMLRLVGSGPREARRDAATVLAMETALARATLTLVQARDPHRLAHKMDRRQLQALTPHFDWGTFLGAVGLVDAPTYNVSEPAFYREFDAQLRTRPMADIRTYLRWHVVHAFAPWLGRPYADEDFDFFHRTLEGVPQRSPRWKQCVALVDRQIGEALGQEFVRVAFTPEAKDRTQRMTRQIEDAMAVQISRLDWMSAQTKARALDKLHGIVNNVGYPDRWRDYAALEIRRDDLLGNVRRGNAFELRRQLARIGQPPDRSEWEMTPQTVNAYYEPQTNTINFPAGILQPPLFDARLDDAPNYGDTGSTIGHELTHGFDDEGRQFDTTGTLRNWWTPHDAAEFDRRAQCLVRQYAGYVVVDDVHINSRLTLGEDLADLGGLVLAYAAWQTQLEAHPAPQPIDGYTPVQRFFIGNAQWACANLRPERQRLLAATDPHSPPRYRVNGLVANFVEFQQAFHCRTGQAMAPANRCRVW